MLYDNEFNCSDGHTFRANAKLRARCPECGKMARRTYVKVEQPTSSGTEGNTPLPSVLPKEDDNGVKLLRRGKPRTIMVAKKTTPSKGKNGRFLPKSNKKSFKAIKKEPTQLVTKRTVTTKKAMPKVTRRPPRTAIARHIDGGQKSYADSMIEQYGYRR